MSTVIEYRRVQLEYQRIIVLVNPLNTKLSCWNFNLVNADQFSRE